MSKNALGSLELEMQVAVSCPVCMLGTELGSSAKVASTLNHWSFSPVPFADF